LISAAAAVPQKAKTDTAASNHELDNANLLCFENMTTSQIWLVLLSH
jgi:hypothetical protein